MPNTLVFWNCGVAPPRGREKRTVDEVADAVGLVFAQGADLVALCEVDKESFVSIRRKLRSLGMGIASTNATGQAGPRSRWDIGLFYRRGAMELAADDILGIWEGEAVRVAVRTSVRLASGTSLRLYVAHWRSQLRRADEHRRKAASLLYQKIARDLNADLPVVVLADFNLEPFHDDMVAGLATSRDPRVVLRYPKEKLFNPTWALVAPPPADPWGSFGSLSYKQTRWLFDQALTSSHFLDDTACRAPSVRIVPSNHRQNDHDLLELTLP